MLQYVKSLVKAFVSWLNPFKAVYRSTLIQIRESGGILTGFVKPAYSFKKFHHSDYSHSGHGQPQGRTKYCVHFRTSQLWVFPTGIMSCETIVVILMVMCFIIRVVLFNTILCTCYLGNKSILFLYDELLLSLIYPHQRCFVLVVPCARQNTRRSALHICSFNLLCDAEDVKPVCGIDIRSLNGDTWAWIQLAREQLSVMIILNTVYRQ